MISKTIRAQFADTMLNVGLSDPNLVVIVGDISHFALQPFARACPERFYNIGICEPATVSFSAGLAKMGFSVVVHTIAPFLIERSFEQLKLDFCYHRLSGNIVTVGSAFDFSNLGCTHHCYNDFALMKTLPGTEILYPGSPIEFDTLFRKAYADDSLTLYRIPANSHKVEFSPSDMEIGKGNKIKDGGNVSIIAIGPHLNTALETAELLSHRDIEAEIIYINSIRPLDTELLGDSIAKTKRVVVIEDHMQTGGLGDDILREFHGKLEFVFLSAAIPDEFIRVYGDYKQLCEHVGLTATVITNRISESCANV